MRMKRATGIAVAALAILPMLATPAAAESTGYTGVVRDVDGNPIQNACLALHRAETEVAAEFCSDEQGRYHITGVPTDVTYRIRTYAEGFRTEWWYGKPTYLTADPVWVPAYDLVERDVTLGRGAGVIRGRITDDSGAPADATVTLHGVDSPIDVSVYTWDFGDGRYEVGNLAPGRYQVSVYDNARGTQWVPQKETQGEAGVFTLSDGQTLVIDEQWLPLGAVEVRVTDAETGEPVSRPCLYVFSVPTDRQACGADGLVRVEDVPSGYWEISVSAYPSYFPLEGRHVEVRRSEVAHLAYELSPAAAIVTTVRDAATNAPVSGVCVHLVAPKWGGQSAHMSQYCSGGDGRLGVGPLDWSGTVQLYAYQPRDPYRTPPKYYGAQWVTADGGTGDQRKALLVEIEAKRTTTVPDIKLDEPGAISGVIRDEATGAPVPGVCTYPYAFQPNQGGVFGRNCSNSEGRYTISDLGPYHWPVEYAPYNGYAWQWSGDVPDRFSAEMVKVTAGDTATMDAHLVQGGTVAGKVTDGERVVDGGYVWTYNATTGDIASPSFTNIKRDGTFSLRGHRTQSLYVEYRSYTAGCWYGTATGTGVILPRRVEVSAGSTTTIAADMTTTCAPHPAGPGMSSFAPPIGDPAGNPIHSTGTGG